MTAQRAGYTFKGWSNSPDGEVVVSLPKTFASGVHVYYAQFTSNDVTVTLDANGGAFSGDIDPLKVSGKYDDKVVYETPMREGYSFVGWASDQNADASTAKRELTYGYDISCDGDEIFAIWKANDISVKYNASQGTFANGEEVTEISGEADGTYTIPDAPERTGYEFKGWFTSPNGAGSDVTSVDNLPTAKDVVYYAKWQKATYKMTLDANGGSFSDESTVSLDGVYEDSVAYNVPTRNGYAFVGWSEDKDATASDAKMQLIYNEGSKDKTYYAIWTPADRSVAFVAIGSSADASKTLSGKVGEEFEVPADPTRTGYVFDGWYTEITGGLKLSANAGATQKFAFDTPTAYYAHFKENKTDVVLHYNDGKTEDVKLSGIEDTNVIYDEVTREGYTFKGWASTEGATEADLGMQPTYPTKPDSGEAVDFYAVWKPDRVTLTFSAQGGYFADGKEVETVNAQTDQSYDLPAAPTRTGYTFAGWFTSTNGQGGQIGENETAPSSNAVYFAKWEGKKIALHLDPNGGKFMPDFSDNATLQSTSITKSGEYKDAVDYTIPARDGYSFLGWSKSGDASEGTLHTLTIPDEETTLKAVWEANDIKITYVASDGQIKGENAGEVVYEGKTDQDVDFAIPTAEKEGYDFVGWSLAADSSVIADDPVAYPTADATYYATYRKDQVSLKFDANGGTIGNSTSATQTQGYGYVVSYETPKRDGYYFTGWSTAPDGSAGSNWNYTYGKGDAQNGTTLYAQWAAFPADLSGEVERIQGELDRAKATGDDNALKAAAAEAEALKLRDENGNLITLNSSLASVAQASDGTSQGTSNGDLAAGNGEQTAQNNGNSGLMNLFGLGPVFSAALWLVMLALIGAAVAFAVNNRRKYKRATVKSQDGE